MVIAVEGMDGAGKTTICSHIARKFNYINIEKPTKYLFINSSGDIDYNSFNEYLNYIYKQDDFTRSQFFALGNELAVTKYKDSDVVIDRHLASNYYWNGNKSQDTFYADLISLCGKPNLTIYLQAMPAVRYSRLFKRNPKDIDLYDKTVFEDGYDKHIEFLKKFNFNYVVIDTNNKTIEEVCREVDRLILELTYGKEKHHENKLF